MTTEHKPHSEWQGVRTRIVAALNHPELVPPQADDETINLVNEAWAALHDGWKLVKDLEEQLESLRRALEEIDLEGVRDDASALACSRLARAALASSPASDPLRLAEADADLAAGRARPASEVFADLSAEQNQDTSRDET